MKEEGKKGDDEKIKKRVEEKKIEKVERLEKRRRRVKERNGWKMNGEDWWKRKL